MKIFKNLFGKNEKIHVDEIAVAPGLLLGGAVIVESGSNANGRYVRFGDGTQICWGKSSILTLSFTPSPNWGSVFTTGGNSLPSMVFPVPFVGDKPYVKLDFERISGGNFWVMRSSANPSLTHSGSGEIVRGTTYSADFTGRATYFAIGRWK